MKRAFVLLAGLTLALSAKALTYSWVWENSIWNTTSDTAPTASAAGYYTKNTPTGSFAWKATFFNLAYVADSTAESYFIGLKTNNTYYGIRINSAREAYAFTTSSTAATDTTTVACTSISGNLSSVFEYDATANQMHFWLGDTKIGTFNNVTLGNNYVFGVGGPPENYATNNLSRSFTYDVGTMAQFSNVIDVPEPTALALLALGVGGVLLKRKRL